MKACVLWTVALCFGVGEVTSSDGQSVQASEVKKASLSCPSFSISNSQSKYLLLFNGNSTAEMLLKKESNGDSYSVQVDFTAAKSGEYVCSREILYPPPFRKEFSDSIQVRVADSQKFSEIESPINDTSGPCVIDTCSDRSLRIPEVALWVGCAALFIYSLTVTCISVVIWTKLKRARQDNEDTKVYANIRPGALKNPYKV